MVNSLYCIVLYCSVLSLIGVCVLAFSVLYWEGFKNKKCK